MGTATVARSARLSDMNVTRAKRAAISGSVRQKLVGQLRPELRAVGVAHDRRRHRARPAEEVASIDSSSSSMSARREAADVALVVDVARRRADQHELADPLGRPRGGQHADHRADRVPDEDRVGRARARRRSRPRRRRSRRGRRSARGRRRRGPSAPAPTWSKSTTRWSASNAGATKRHMFWSQPNPWAKTIGRPSGRPRDPDVVAGENVHAPGVYDH